MIGHRAIWKDGWKAVTFHDQGVDYDKDTWSLYDLTTDFSEMHDLADSEPQRLKDMVETWWEEARRYGVLPLDDRAVELFGAKPRPGSPHYGNTYTYYPPIAHIPSDACPMLSGRAWTIQCDVEVGDSPVEGVLYARGSHNLGHSLFIKDSTLHFVYNALGKIQRASAPLTLTPGRHVIGARFDRTDNTGELSIFVDGRDIASVHIPVIMRILGSMGMDLGCDRLSPVAPDYAGPFPFTGTLHRVHFEVRSKMTKVDTEVQARVESSRE